MIFVKVVHTAPKQFVANQLIAPKSVPTKILMVTEEEAPLAARYGWWNPWRYPPRPVEGFGTIPEEWPPPVRRSAPAAEGSRLRRPSRLARRRSAET